MWVKGKVDISHHVTAKLFWFITLMILLLPITSKYRLLIWGSYTTGVVVGEENVRYFGFSVFGPDKYPVIRFTTTDGEIIQFYGPENFEYPMGSVLKVVYNPKKPTDCMVFSIGAFYTHPKAIVPGILFILWMAFYLAFRAKK